MLSLAFIVGCAKTPADYRWVSSDANVLSVSATGVVQAKRPGKATVRVISIFDSLNFDEVPIFGCFYHMFCFCTSNGTL